MPPTAKILQLNPSAETDQTEKTCEECWYWQYVSLKWTLGTAPSQQQNFMTNNQRQHITMTNAANFNLVSKTS